MSNLNSAVPFSFDLSIYRSASISSVWFDDFIKEHEVHFECSTYYKTALIILGDKLDEPYKTKTQYNKMLKRELIALWEVINDGYSCEEYTKADLIADLESLTTKDYIIAMRDYLGDSEFYDKYTSYAAVGHSQGDYCHIVDLGGTHYTKENIEHLLYDAPISGVFCIADNLTGETSALYLDELLLDSYKYDKNELLEQFTKCYSSKHYFNDSLEYLKHNLPDGHLDCK